MTVRTIRLALGVASVVFAAVAPSAAQASETRGVVQRVDVPSGTVYFTDGRTVRIDPASQLHVGTRQVALADVQPGWTLVVPAGAAVPQVIAATPPASAPPRPPVDATGVVSRVDPQNGTITLQDGRVLHMTGRTTLWQPVPITSVTPGASVYVRGAEPLDFRPGASTSAARYQMGTISSIDAARARVTLADGTIVHLAPGSRLEINGQSLTITDLRPGDEVVIGVAPATTGPMLAAGGSALPAQALILDGRELFVVRRPQSP
jgi:Cu/Ag efflux protein CusF